MWIGRLFGFLALSLMLTAQQMPVNLRTAVDIAGSAATVAVATSGGAEWVQINAPDRKSVV